MGRAPQAASRACGLGDCWCPPRTTRSRRPPSKRHPTADGRPRWPLTRGILIGTLLGSVTPVLFLLVPAAAIVLGTIVGSPDLEDTQPSADVSTVSGIVSIMLVIGLIGSAVAVPLGGTIGAVTGAITGCAVRWGVRSPRTAALLAAGIALTMWALVFVAYVLWGIDSVVTGQALLVFAGPALVGAPLAAWLGRLVARGPGAPSCCATLRAARARRHLTPAS